MKNQHIPFYKIIDDGIYYYPAWRKYSNEKCIVICDRCNKSNIRACIGLDIFDLCLKCVFDLTECKL
jgi:hypothetical protein